MEIVKILSFNQYSILAVSAFKELYSDESNLKRDYKAYLAHQKEIYGGLKPKKFNKAWHSVWG